MNHVISIDISGQANATIVHLSGALDQSTFSQFDAALEEQVGTGGRSLIIDLSKVDQIDEAGLRQLYLSLKKARQSGKDLLLAQPQEVVLDALTASRLDEIFVIYETLAEALAHL